jgi:hypothetical protein
MSICASEAFHDGLPSMTANHINVCLYICDYLCDIVAPRLPDRNDAICGDMCTQAHVCADAYVHVYV